MWPMTINLIITAFSNETQEQNMWLIFLESFVILMKHCLDYLTANVKKITNEAVKCKDLYLGIFKKYILIRSLYSLTILNTRLFHHT